MAIYRALYLCLFLLRFAQSMSEQDMHLYREKVKGMFYHAYNGYMKYAFPYDELKPVSCTGQDTWGSYSLTLIDTLDTLLVMGNKTEFIKVTDILTQTLDFDRDINVSVFETNIRVIGGLLSAHLLSANAGIKVEPDWPCQGPLLRLAVDAAERLLPAFNTSTGMPYGTVNLRYGIPFGETPVTCTAGVGTFIIEFGTMSRLTGDKRFEKAAMNALKGLWRIRSKIGLVGNHVNVETGTWTAKDAAIGPGIDSYYEYLLKGAILLRSPELMEMFEDIYHKTINYTKVSDWYIWADMNKGNPSMITFHSLDAYWPGLQSLYGDIGEASRTLAMYHGVWRKFGFTPEFYQIKAGLPIKDRESYPLRPELIESTMYLYQATKDSYFLDVGRDIFSSIEYQARTRCGYASVKNIINHVLEDKMESFFLAETTKYLYLLFDPDNFLHGNNQQLNLETGSNCRTTSQSFVFNTEAHPIDIGALQCCQYNDKTRTKQTIGRLKCKARKFEARLSFQGTFVEQSSNFLN